MSAVHDAIRKAIAKSRKSRYRLWQETGISQVVCVYAMGQSGLNVDQRWSISCGQRANAETVGNAHQFARQLNVVGPVVRARIWRRLLVWALFRKP